jgi:hypothetical protein
MSISKKPLHLSAARSSGNAKLTRAGATAQIGEFSASPGYRPAVQHKFPPASRQLTDTTRITSRDTVDRSTWV